MNTFFDRQKPGIIAAAIVIACTVLAVNIAPRLLGGLFHGPDRDRWLVPFILCMGAVATAYAVLLNSFRKFDSTIESLFAWAFIFLFGGMLIFVAIQRFTSGLRVYETLNACLSIRLSEGKSIYCDPEVAPPGSIYTPLFHLICALPYTVLPKYWAYGRLFALFATLGTSFLVYRCVRLLGQTKIAGLWGSALFLGTYTTMAHFYDMYSIDPFLALPLTLTLFFFLQRTEKYDLLALTTAVLACLTKQNAAFPFLVVLGFSVRSVRWKWLAGFLAFGRSWEFC
jgi:hypothetical protein